MHHLLKIKVDNDFEMRKIFDINEKYILSGYKIFLSRKSSGTISQLSKISRFYWS